MASLSRNSARDAVIDFISTPFFKDYKDIMYKRLDVTKDWRLLLDIYRPSVLLCIGAALIGIIILYLVIQFSPNEIRDRQNCRNVSNVGLYVFGALFSQGVFKSLSMIQKINICRLDKYQKKIFLITRRTLNKIGNTIMFFFCKTFLKTS